MPRGYCLIPKTSGMEIPIFGCTGVYAFRTRSTQYLFGPFLIEPIENSLAENPCVPTANGYWVKPAEVVCLTESADATKAMVEMGLMAEDELVPAFSGKANAKLAHPKVAENQITKSAKADRWNLFDNQNFFQNKAGGGTPGIGSVNFTAGSINFQFTKSTFITRKGQG